MQWTWLKDIELHMKELEGEVVKAINVTTHNGKERVNEIKIDFESGKKFAIQVDCDNCYGKAYISTEEL